MPATAKERAPKKSKASKGIKKARSNGIFVENKVRQMLTGAGVLRCGQDVPAGIWAHVTRPFLRDVVQETVFHTQRAGHKTLTAQHHLKALLALDAIAAEDPTEAA